MYLPNDFYASLHKYFRKNISYIFRFPLIYVVYYIKLKSVSRSPLICSIGLKFCTDFFIDWNKIGGWELTFLKILKVEPS